MACADERSDARERALLLLYEAEAKGISVDVVLGEQVIPTDELTTLLVRGVQANQERIDAAIADHAKGWSLQRMPSIDRNVLRIAAFELLGRADVPVALILDEAVELAKRISTDDSRRESMLAPDSSKPIFLPLNLSGYCSSAARGAAPAPSAALWVSLK